MASSKSNHHRSLCGVTHEGSPNIYLFLFLKTDPNLQRTALPHEASMAFQNKHVLLSGGDANSAGERAPRAAFPITAGRRQRPHASGHLASPVAHPGHPRESVHASPEAVASAAYEPTGQLKLARYLLAPFPSMFATFSSQPPLDRPYRRHRRRPLGLQQAGSNSSGCRIDRIRAGCPGVIRARRRARRRRPRISSGGIAQHRRAAQEARVFPRGGRGGRERREEVPRRPPAPRQSSPRHARHRDGHASPRYRTSFRFPSAGGERLARLSRNSHRSPASPTAR